MIPERLKRGDLVAIVTSGDYGKPRPALIIQSNAFDGLVSVTVLPLSSHLIEAPLYRVTIQPDQGNGLRQVSQVMVDKAVTVLRVKVGQPVGQVDSAALEAVTKAFRGFFEL